MVAAVVVRGLRVGLGSVAGGILPFAAHQRIFDAVASVDELEWGVAGQTQLH